MGWKKGKGKLSIFDPLLGSWQAETRSEMGNVKCKRVFKKVLSGKYIQLEAKWEIAERHYDELALIGINSVKEVCFWSFTSDGKQSDGKLTDVSDIHPEAIGLVAQMSAGIARMAYWPDGENGFYWVVESKVKKGWNRFVEHHYLPINESRI